MLPALGADHKTKVAAAQGAAIQSQRILHRKSRDPGLKCAVVQAAAARAECLQIPRHLNE